MKQFYKYILLFIALTAWTTIVCAEGGAPYKKSNVWYSLYETTEYNRSTSAGGTIHSYSVFPPVSGSFTFDTKLESAIWALGWQEPENYNLTFAGKTISVTQREIDDHESYKTSWGTRTYTYTYIPKSGSGLSADITSADMSYEYKLYNAARTVYVKNVKVPMAPHIRFANGGVGTNSLSYNNGTAVDVEWGRVLEIPVTLRSFLTKNSVDADKTLTVTTSNSAVHIGSETGSTSQSWNVGKNQFAQANTPRDKDISTYNVTVYIVTSALSVGDNQTFTVTYNNNGMTAVYTIKINVKKATPVVVTKPTASAISYGQILSASNISGAVIKVPTGISGWNESFASQGTFAWQNPTVVLNAGTHINQIIVFTPTDQTHYNSITITGVSIKVNKATTTITDSPTATNITYLQTLANSTISGGQVKSDVTGAVVAGTFDWVSPSTAPNAGENQCFKVKFTVSDAVNYKNPSNVNVCIDVAKANPTFTWNAQLKSPNEVMVDDVVPSVCTSNNSQTTLTTERTGFIFSGINNDKESTLSGTTLNANGAGTINIRAHQDATSNFNEKTETLSVVVHKYTNSLAWKASNPWSVAIGTSMPSPITPTSADALCTTNNAKTFISYSSGNTSAVKFLDEPQVLSAYGTGTSVLTASQVETYKYEAGSASITMNVGKADPVFTWYLTPNVRQGSSFVAFVRSTNTETSLTWSIKSQSPAGTVVRDGEKLRINNIIDKDHPTNTATFTIEATQAANDNFNKKTETYTCTVHYNSGVCVEDINPLTGDQYNGGMVYAVNDALWDSSNDYETSSYIGIPVEISHHEGVVLGNWEEGFKGLSFAVLRDYIRASYLNLLGLNSPWKWTDRNVDLSFTGTPASISFVTTTQTVKPYVELAGNQIGVTYNSTGVQWELWESADGNDWNKIWNSNKNDNNRTGNNAVNLQPTTRFVRFFFGGNFAGFVKNIRITPLHKIEVLPTSLEFGNATHPLQEPQTVTVRHWGVGNCGDSDPHITVTSTNPAFEADVVTIRRNVGVDFIDTYDVQVRCTQMGQTGKIVFTGSNTPETKAELTLSSLTPEITPSTGFQTGTERNYVDENHYYTGLRTLTFENCFDGSGNAIMDYLYLFGVTVNVPTDHNYETYDPSGKYKLPVINSPDEVSTGCNGLTPCFVYRKDGNHYTFDRQFYATQESLGEISARNKKIYFAGYLPFAYTGTTQDDPGFVCFTEPTDVYMENLTMYARYHTESGCGSGESYTPQTVKLYLGNNFLNSSGALMTWRGGTQQLHVAGTNRLRGNKGILVKEVETWSRGKKQNADFKTLHGQILPSPALACLPLSTSDEFSLSINDTWTDSKATGGSLKLTHSTGSQEIDKGLENSTLTKTGNLFATTASTRLMMAESDGQGFSLYGVGEEYAPSADAWTAALPNREIAAESGQKRLVYADLGGEERGVLSNTGNFTAGSGSAADRQYIIKSVSADAWQTMTAPFDVHNVYLLEAMPEASINGMYRKDAVSIQKDVLGDLLDYLEADLPNGAKAVSADKSLIVLISNWIGERRDGTNAVYDDNWTGDKANYKLRGLKKLTNYNGSNLWSADWYLYEIPGEQSWKLRDEKDGPSSFEAEWTPVNRGGGEALMHKGQVYSWRLPYCSMCEQPEDPDDAPYDYWSGKWLIFEGVNTSATIDGKTSSASAMTTVAGKATSTVGWFGGNTAFGDVTPPENAFVHDQNPRSETYDCFVRFTGNDFNPTISCIFLNVPAKSGRRIKAITRSGEILYEDQGFDVATNTRQLNTSNTLDAWSDCEGRINISSSENCRVVVYAADGRLVYGGQLSAGQTITIHLPSGIYMAGNTAGEVKKVAIR